MLLQDVNISLERTKMDIEARSQSKKDQMSGKVSFQNNIRQTNAIFISSLLGKVVCQ